MIGPLILYRELIMTSSHGTVALLKTLKQIPSVVQELKLEQSRVEADILFIGTGREIRYKCKRRKEKESRIYTMVSSYKDHSRLKFLELMSLNLGSFELKKINLVPSYMYINTLFLINYYFGLILFCIDNK